MNLAISKAQLLWAAYGTAAVVAVGDQVAEEIRRSILDYVT